MKHFKKSFGTMLLALLLPVMAFAQNITVKGTVSDANGDPIPGAYVAVQNTTTGTVTDIDGNYSISVPRNAALEFSFMGYVTSVAPVNGRTEINATLLEDAEALEATVVIGYGTARKTDVTGSIASMGGNDLREIPANDITKALMGRIAGVDMQSSSSKPGSSMTIRIRGERSLSASNDPLIVLDGIPFMGSLTDISTNDIKSIDILKDAASTAIYGSRGANGVILISTYKGTEGQEPRVSFNTYAAFKTPIKYPLMHGQKYLTMRDMAGQYRGLGIDEEENCDTDWQDLLYRNGYTQNYELSVSGGTRNGNYRFGTSYYQDQAVIPTQKYDRLSLNGSVDQAIGKWFRVGFQTNTQYGTNEGNNIGPDLQLSPLANPYNEDGSVKKRVTMVADVFWSFLTRERAEQYREQGVLVSDSNNLSTYNNGYVLFNFPWIKGLSFKATAGLNYRRSRSGSFTGQGIMANTDASPNSASWSFSENQNWTVENLLTYDRTFAQKHRLNVVALYSAEQTTSNGQSLSGKNIPNELFQWYNIGACLATDITVSKGSYSQSGLLSYMGRIMYTYDDKYMIQAAVRTDASSRLSPGHQWHTYPAVSVGWNIHKEPFMAGTRGWLDELKLRVGYGVTSNQSVSAYATLGSLSTKVYNFNESYATGYYVSSLPNTELGWEYSNTWNYGIDYSFFKGRLRGTVEYYSVKTKDILLSLGLPSSAGVSRTTANIGATQNKGLEMTINGTVIDSGDWKWDLGLNIYANRNKLVALADGTKEDKGNRWFVGYPLNCIYDYEYDGLWNEGDPYMDILEPSKFDTLTGYKGSVGMIKVKYHGDYNADGSPTRAINSNDQVPRSGEAIFMGGYNSRLSWRNWDLSVIGNFQLGGIFRSSLQTGYENLLNGRRGNLDVDYWTEDNHNAKYPRPGATRTTDNPKYSSLLGYFNGTFLNINTITMGYSLHKLPFFKSAGIHNLRIYATVQNPCTIYSEFTKETGLFHQGNARSGHASSMSVSTPNTHNYLLGVNLTF